MSGNPVVTAEEKARPRKVRRNIHCCVECKRRKVRCQLSTGNVVSCVGCLNRGIVCVVQQAQREDEITIAVHFDEKLDRIESLLTRLVENDVSSASGTTLSANPLANSSGSTVDQDSSSENHVASITNRSNFGKNGAIDAFLNNHQDELGQAHEQINSMRYERSKKLDEIRQMLSSLLPSQPGADLIGAATNSWALAQVFCTPANDLFKNDDPLSSFNLMAVSKRHPTIIARTLLYIAICIQQLPPEFDMTRLRLRPSLNAVMEEYISAVTIHVTSNDELATTIEGLECLQLQGLFHLNAGNPQRAWISFRRGLNIAQLMCIDKDFMKARKGLDSTSINVGKQMWHQFVMSDRYVCLLLGLPCGVGDDCFGPEETLNNVNDDLDLIFERRLSLIAGHISKRNEAELDSIFSQTQWIDEEMDHLAKETPQSWWNVPQLDGKNRSRDVARQFNRLTTQMWFYQLETLLHLPFMLRAATEYRYEYNRQTCLTASREILYLYMALRNANNTQLLCRVVDFAAFIAAVVINLGSIHTSQPNEGIRFRQRNEDMALLQDIILSMESLAESSEREFVAEQSAAVLRTLSKFNDPSRTSNGNLRLTVPYFGTINITHSTLIQDMGLIKSVLATPKNSTMNVVEMLQHDHAVPDQDTNAEHFYGNASNSSLQYTPTVTFTSSQFLSMGPEPSIDNWEWQEEDTLLFDSLLSSDIGGFGTF